MTGICRHVGHSSWKEQKAPSSRELCALKLPKRVFQKHAITLEVAMVTKSGRRRLKQFQKKSSVKELKLKAVAQGILKIHY